MSTKNINLPRLVNYAKTSHITVVAQSAADCSSIMTVIVQHHETAIIARFVCNRYQISTQLMNDKLK